MKEYKWEILERVLGTEYWTKLVECNALQVAVHFENCTALLRIAVHLLPKM